MSRDGRGNKNLEETSRLIPIYILGKRFSVPESLSLLEALQVAGYRMPQGHSCRGGVCAGCAATYRKGGDYQLRTGLACQTPVEAGLALTEVPSALQQASQRSSSSSRDSQPTSREPAAQYCGSCHSHSRLCPRDVPVLDYQASLRRGEFAHANAYCYRCIPCAQAATRCMVEFAQQHIAAQMSPPQALLPPSPSTQLLQMVERIRSQRYHDQLTALTKANRLRLEVLYHSAQERQIEPYSSDSYWTPTQTQHL